MSVIIKGMKMPSSCADCNFYIDAQRCGESVLSEGSFCANLNIDIVEEGKKDENCPLVKIPSPHGKIIDADAEIKRYGLDKATKYGNKTEEELNFSYSQMLMYEIAGLFENAPTILDAEEGEET